MRPGSAICAVWLCAAMAACQGGPTAPDRTPTIETGLLPAGTYLLSVGTDQPQDSHCTGPVEAWGLFGPTIGAFITLSARGDGWVGRVESPSDGAFELELRRGSGTSAGLTITGTLRGTMTHFLDRFLSAPPRTAFFAGKDGNVTAMIEGTLVQSRILIGTASGHITFTHTSGTVVACPQTSLFLS